MCHLAFVTQPPRKNVLLLLLFFQKKQKKYIYLLLAKHKWLSEWLSGCYLFGGRRMAVEGHLVTINVELSVSYIFSRISAQHLSIILSLSLRMSAETAHTTHSSSNNSFYFFFFFEKWFELCRIRCIVCSVCSVSTKNEVSRLICFFCFISNINIHLFGNNNNNNKSSQEEWNKGRACAMWTQQQFGQKEESIEENWKIAFW